MLELMHLPLKEISESPSNTRKYFSEKGMTELTESIKSQGVLQPILARPRENGYEIVAGARRYRAAQTAGLPTIPAVVREMSDQDALEATVIENLQREDVHPIEEAEGFERLMSAANYNADQVAEKIGKSRSHVYGRLKLLELSQEARDAFFDGKLDASTALLVARIPGKTLQKRAMGIIIEGFGGAPMSYRSAKDIVCRQFMLSLDQAAFDRADKKLSTAGCCTDCPKRTGNNPELFGDVKDANVCTDPDCFEDKRQAHYLKLCENAEQKGIKVLTGKDAEKTMPHGSVWNLIDDLMSIDQDFAGSGGKSYRDILGKKTPVEILIENNGYQAKVKPFIEVASETTLQAALKKAGFVPVPKDEYEPEDLDPAKSAKIQKYQDAMHAKQKAEALERDIERRWRVRLFELIRERNAAGLATNKALQIDELRALAICFYDQSVGKGDEHLSRLMEMWGSPWNDQLEDEENSKVFIDQVIAEMDVHGLSLFLFDMALLDEVLNNSWYSNNHEAPGRLLAQADRLGISAAVLRAEIEMELQAPQKPARKAKTGKPATPAAQAEEQSAKKTAPAKAKAKAKATPAAPSGIEQAAEAA